MNVENQTVEQQEKIGMTDGDDRNELQPSCMRGIKSILIDRGVVTEIPTVNAGDIAYDKNTGAKVLVIGWHPHQPVVVVEGDEIYTLTPLDISLEKPETPEQKKERERLESGKVLYELVQNIWCDIDDKYAPTNYSSPVVTKSVKEMYARLAEEVGYRK